MRRIFTAVVVCFLLCATQSAQPLYGAERIAVIVSSSELPFEETLDGFRQYLEKQGKAVTFDLYRCDGDAAQAEKSARAAVRSHPRMVFALGSLGVDAVVKQAPDVPLVAGLVLRPEIVAQATNATGVTLEFPLELQFKWMRTMLPDVARVGVIYNPSENRARVTAAERIARSFGFRLESLQVGAPRDVPPALEILSRKVDVIWGLADNLALSPQIAKFILLFSFRNSIPLIGPSVAWVRAGALYSLDWDYHDLGAQCGEMAVRILDGTRPGAIPLATPRKVLYSVNRKIAQRMKLKLSKKIIEGARNVY